MRPPCGLYVHVPFCARACPYCDFDFAVNRRPDAEAFIAGLQAEFDSRSQEIARFSVDTIYLGGGTPSVLGPAGLRLLFAWMAKNFVLDRVREWTVEVNPEHVDDALLAALVEAGVDRISLGVQTLDDGGLRQLGRAHNAARALGAIRSAAAVGLRVSADLIVGWPEQSARCLEDDVEQLVALSGLDHLSVYALTIEPGTPWVRLAQRGVRSLPVVDAQTDLLVASEQLLERAGWQHYEIASYCRHEGAEAAHNSGYWLGRAYLGLGPSAASARFERGCAVRRTNARGQDWWDQLAPTTERLDAEQSAAEGLWLALRCLRGVEISAYLARHPSVDLAWIERRCARQVRLGNLLFEPAAQLRVAPGRWLWHDDIAVDLLAP